MTFNYIKVTQFDGFSADFYDSSLSIGVSDELNDILVISSVKKADSVTFYHRCEILLHTIKSITFVEDEKE